MVPKFSWFLSNLHPQKTKKSLFNQLQLAKTPKDSKSSDKDIASIKLNKKFSISILSSFVVPVFLSPR
jgi:hypothetical protein